MDATDAVLDAAHLLETGLAAAEDHLSQVQDLSAADRALRHVLEANVERMRGELERLRREYAAQVAAHLRC